MQLPPLSHHEILALVGPFSRSGRLVDLPGSDRPARSLAFQPRTLPADGALPALQERLTLQNPRAGHHVLLRTLVLPDGRSATLSAEGADPADLLARIDAIPPAHQFSVSPAATAVLQQQLADDNSLRLQRAEAPLNGLMLRLTITGVSGFPAELELLRTPGDALQLPRDLLAVLGRGWDRLTPLARGWLCSVQVRGHGGARSADAQARFQQALAHLAHTFAEPPQAFHQRHLRARWRVAMRGTLPLIGGAAIVALAFVLRDQGGRAASALALLANVAPPLLMGLFFVRREMPQIGLPQIPRRPQQAAWR